MVNSKTQGGFIEELKAAFLLYKAKLQDINWLVETGHAKFVVPGTHGNRQYRFGSFTMLSPSLGADVLYGDANGHVHAHAVRGEMQALCQELDGDWRALRSLVRWQGAKSEEERFIGVVLASSEHWIELLKTRAITIDVHNHRKTHQTACNFLADCGFSFYIVAPDGPGLVEIKLGDLQRQVQRRTGTDTAKWQASMGKLSQYPLEAVVADNFPWSKVLSQE